MSESFYGGTMSSRQVLKSRRIVDYDAPQSIMLSPRFETTLSLAFTAELANYVNQKKARLFAYFLLIFFLSRKS
ncbi:MAG: hypothetical protein ACJARG_001365 [Arcticibacterium sp.]|jgi:hypothetical protein